MMKHIKMNLKNCLNIEMKTRLLITPSCFPSWKVAAWISCFPNGILGSWSVVLHPQPCSYRDKVALLPCFISKWILKISEFYFFDICVIALYRGCSEVLWKNSRLLSTLYLVVYNTMTTTSISMQLRNFGRGCKWMCKMKKKIDAAQYRGLVSIIGVNKCIQEIYWLIMCFVYNSLQQNWKHWGSVLWNHTTLI